MHGDNDAMTFIIYKEILAVGFAEKVGQPNSY